ncbi:hypothetical protein ACQR1I_32245 [Bradyrhizobium sp. HKCCYLS2038]|uniref:hypothetical protein n=1 Tax=unclassified Bradyrhizobium TaxID=2631580 RepID=UPI003EBCA460
MKDLHRLRQQVKAAWARVPSHIKPQLQLKMLDAHNHAVAVRNKAVAAVVRPTDRELVALHRLLRAELEGELLAPGAVFPEDFFTTVGPNGEVYFGDVDYDSTDLGWAYCFPAMVLTEDQTPPFTVGNTVQIPDSANLALLGDWGGANAPALAVGAAAKAADYLIHLGDVYYAGTNGDDILDPIESTNFVEVWPGAAGKSFALNSNHEMYAHATGYSLTTLAAPAFASQGGNCFALTNNAFRIVGLDSAYYAPDNQLKDFPGYMIGSLGDPQGAQIQFLQNQIARLGSGQSLILLTHHNGLNLDGSVPTAADAAYLLWQQVTQVLQQIPSGASRNVVWYWGHQHAAAVYNAQQINGITITPRCCGHGCIPWGVATDLSQSGNVLWYEGQNLGPGTDYFVTNGYATLTLNGAALTESFWNQNGQQSWTTPTAV